MSVRGRTGGWLLALWAIAMMVVLASLSLRHVAALPAPDDATRLSTALLHLRHGSSRKFVVHVIYSECSCSRSLFAHLMARGPFADSEELVLFTGTDPAKRDSAVRAGFAFIEVTASELVSRFGLEAAPVMVEFDKAGQLRYAGGYYTHPAAITPVDERVHTQLALGTDVDPLPIFGCAVSPRLRKSLDPLGLL